MADAPLRDRNGLKGEGGRSVFEALIVLVAVAIFVLVAADRYVSSIKALRETALTIELANLRSAVIFYATVNGRLPSSLKELTREKAVVTKRDITGKDYDIVVAGSYVESMTEDDEGRPLDAFGNPFAYNPATGRVSSTTNGYEMW